MKYHLSIVFLILFTIHIQLQAQSNKLEDFANFNKYRTANEELAPPLPGENRVVFMGNSITEGWKISDESFFSDNPYIDRGISGQTTPQMLLRFRSDVINLKPEIVVILAGINDIAENTGPITLEDILENIISMSQLAESNGIKVILCSVLPANEISWNPVIKPAEKVIRLNGMIKSYCLEKNILYVDYYTSMVDERNGLYKKYSEDGVHPNLAGYKVMEPVILEAISKLIEK